MLNITLKELIEKLSKAPGKYSIDPEMEVITDAWIAGENDRNYPPGSVVIQCESRNTKFATPDDVHILSIHPKNIGKLQ